MLQFLWDPHGYFFWLLVVSLFCFLLERIVPWRRGQRALREQLGQDLFWLIWNGHFLGLLLAYAAAWVLGRINRMFDLGDLPAPEALRLLTDSPLWLQFIIFFVLKDFLEWCVHNLLHRVRWLWQFHKLHHSIETMDWIGSFRFHWMEVIVYKSIKYFPLVILGIDGRVILSIAVLSTLVGHLNHSNVNISWGIFRYVLNSPRMHIWHHDVVLHQRSGQNFAVVFSLWDWIFGTASMPDGQPEKLGFEQLAAYPGGLLPRLVYPFWKKRPALGSSG
ncbi:MAG: sterol desaturase family protein [bacterium]|nr:sterol desaturase family protein [bacterium]